MGNICLSLPFELYQLKERIDLYSLGGSERPKTDTNQLVLEFLNYRNPGVCTVDRIHEIERRKSVNHVNRLRNYK